ncbi:DEAD/DEAH box helicase [Puniceicoccales bacterium CK1056]|uniref:DEAD/DEAH box helicase n=1 Tax=Oceanipulchritudo coccoides TaxID=2706888 RepID=A0A6B2M3F2_9BACT|nr:DEAD/DEAH box helicase [Oceanipulchritudo coccoides]NDV63283.1 DEAD/DEAH box helicase [Oceanipulchritudo coccoides]
MIHRTPQRSYTPNTMETWFERLNRDWENFFTEKELRWGRNYYRTSEVRSTELLPKSAIIHFKQGKEPLYVIVDWDESGPSFRESHPDVAPGHGLAVAGMYELEEFIADELPPVTETEKGQHDRLENNGEGPKPFERPIEQPKKTDKTGRRLRVRLTTRTDGLWLESGWKGKEDKIDWSKFSLRELTSWEREQLIGYTARAHRCGFRPGDREGTYRLQEPEVIERFFLREISEWKRRYGLVEGEGVAAWKRGLALVRPSIDVKADGIQSRFRFDFSHRGTSVSEEIRQQLFRHPGHVHFVPGEGIFKVDPGSLGSVHEWKSLLPSEGEGILPRYLLFTFARDPNVDLRLSREVARWRRQLEEASEGLEEVELPDYLRPYQKEGVSWLRKLEAAGCHTLLADEMGLGKTLQILTYLNAQDALGEKPVMVVCPASVVPVWQAEVERFFPGTPIRILSRTNPLDADSPALWICSYTQLRRNKHQLEEIEFAYAILDEAQSIKNPDAKVTHACFAIRSRQRIALTGTPMENRPLDLWTLFRFLMPGFLGSRRQFEDLVKLDETFLPRLRTQITPFVLRRTKLAVASDLPPKVEFDWICPLTSQQRRFYEELTKGASGEFKDGLSTALKHKRMHLFSLLTRLRQACCDPSLLPDHSDHWTHSGKLMSLIGRLEEAFEGGSKVVIFSQFVQFLRRARIAVKSEYPHIPQMELTGSTLDREQPVKRFREADGAAVFFVSLRAGGTGLNLQTADYVFLLDPWWNPAVEAQAIDRVHRIGQKKRVIVYRMITKGTIEERIERLKHDKGQLFEDLLSDMDAPVDIFKQFGSLQDLIALEDEPLR